MTENLILKIEFGKIEYNLLSQIQFENEELGLLILTENIAKMFLDITQESQLSNFDKCDNEDSNKLEQSCPFFTNTDVIGFNFNVKFGVQDYILIMDLKKASIGENRMAVYATNCKYSHKI